MYDYRNMTPEERVKTLQWRHQMGFPLHAPLHFRAFAGEYLITAACYQHRTIVDGPDLLSWLTQTMLNALTDAGLPCTAWVFLPNHYHLLLELGDIGSVGEMLRKLHSRTATQVNSWQGQRGRRVWYRFSDRLIRSERHHWASVNYIHYNAVKHGYVDFVEEWPWSSLQVYLERHGRAPLAQIWASYPVGDYGKGWDW